MPLVRVISDDVVTSPVTGRRGALVRLELVEEDASLGVVVLGDVVRLAGESEILHVVVRRARLDFAPAPDLPLARIVPELAPLLRASRGGTLAVREHVIVRGDVLRLVQDDSGAVSLFLA